MIAATLRTAAVVLLILAAIFTGGLITAGTALITEAIFGVCMLAIGYLIRSAVQERRDHR